MTLNLTDVDKPDAGRMTVKSDMHTSTDELFKYRKHPLKALYIIYFFATLIFRVAYWAFIALIPSLRPRPSWSFTRTFMALLTRATVTFLFAVGPDILKSVEAEPEPGSDPSNASKTGFVWVEPVPPELVKGEVADMAKVNKVYPSRVPAYWYGKRNEDGGLAHPARVGEKVLYHFHGGGYIMGTGSPKGYNSPIPTSLLKHCPNALHRVLSLSYRLSSSFPFEPVNPFPAALLDALAGYHYLVKTMGFSPEDIILSGDSAGGNLALALVRYLIEERVPDLQVPQAVILLSPSGNWERTLKSDIDFALPFFTSGYSARSILGALPPSAIRTNPYFSPASLELDSYSESLSAIEITIPGLKSLKPIETGLFAGFPPTCIVAGGLEASVDSIRILRDRMRADIGEGKKGLLYLECEDAIHDFVVLEWYEPERGQVLRALAKWLEGL